MSKSSIEEILKKEGRYVSTTVGDSMEPMLYNRQNHIVIKTFEGVLNKYDIPLYKRPQTGKYVFHRIVKVDKKRKIYITVGDNRWKKEKVPFDWVLGVMEGYYIGEKYISSTDEDYLKYVKKHTRKYPFRAIKLICKGAVRKWKQRKQH